MGQRNLEIQRKTVYAQDSIGCFDGLRAYQAEGFY